MANDFVTALYPTGTTPTGEPDLPKNATGIAVSGGGSRSLTCAIGQYRALKYLGVLDNVAVISSVSGGTWASASFVYLPSNFDDDDFLGTPTPDPASLTVSGLSQLSPNNLGNAPTRMSWPSVIEVLHHLKSKYNYSNDNLWQGLIGERIFQLWNLWKVGSDGLPLYYFSDSAETVASTITPNNPQLGAAQFTLQQRKRPLLVMNSSIFSDQDIRGARLLPFESTPFGTGVRATFPGIGPGEREIGGGLIQPFAMGSPTVDSVTGNLATVAPPARPFSIVDMASISSAAFAQTVQEKFPEFDGLLPRYPYWPVANPTQPEELLYWFADGGSLENTGICALLARGVTRIISFINTQTPLLTKPLDQGGSVTIDTSVQLLFGLDPDAKSAALTESYVASAPNATPDFVQVFETAPYYDLMKGLAIANVQDGGPAMFKQMLKVLNNPNFDIPGGTEVEILWVYNTAVRNWNTLLSPSVQSTVNSLSHFPNYLTIEQLGLSATEVNALAELSFWNLVSNAEMVKSMFG
ncbi:MAG: hypothetical protein JO093_03375 [Acidobacteria bacterium]|nr:hypothetical protein [Acidobacteriota bacterium]MBV9184630.1 hypothetical protein [Acidobacteriota bacterium]